MRERAGSFGRTSGDTARQRPKALTLSTSRSETALSSHLVGGHRAVLSAVNPPTMEEESSPESTGEVLPRSGWFNKSNADGTVGWQWNKLLQ